MSYHALGQPGWHPGFPGGLPGPISRAPGPIGPTMRTSIFPTHTRVGDVVTITGPFAGLMQGQVRVKFEGTSWLSPQMMGPATASVVVPQGARTGLCEVEVNGRRTGGSNCVIDQGVDRVGRPSHKGRDTRAWTQKGELMGYIPTGQAVRATANGSGRTAPRSVIKKLIGRTAAAPTGKLIGRTAAAPKRSVIKKLIGRTAAAPTKKKIGTAAKPLNRGAQPGATLSTEPSVDRAPVDVELPPRLRKPKRVWKPRRRPEPRELPWQKPEPSPGPPEDVVEELDLVEDIVEEPPPEEIVEEQEFFDPEPTTTTSNGGGGGGGFTGGGQMATHQMEPIPFDIPEEMLEPDSLPPPTTPKIPWKTVGIAAAALGIGYFLFSRRK